MESLLEGLSSGLMTNALLVVIGIYVVRIKERADERGKQYNINAYKINSFMEDLYNNKVSVSVRDINAK